MAVGDYGTILRTADYCSTWVQQTSHTTQVLYGVDMADEATVFAVGRYGTILRTTNGGTEWVEQMTPTTNVLQAVSVPAPLHAAAVGFGGMILHTTTGGDYVTPAGILERDSRQVCPVAELSESLQPVDHDPL